MFRETGFEVVERIRMAQDRNKWWATVNGYDTTGSTKRGKIVWLAKEPLAFQKETLILVSWLRMM